MTRITLELRNLTSGFVVDSCAPSANTRDVAMNRRQRDDAQAFDEAWNARARTPRAELDDEIARLVACAEQLCEAAVAEPSAGVPVLAAHAAHDRGRHRPRARRARAPPGPHRTAGPHAVLRDPPPARRSHRCAGHRRRVRRHGRRERGGAPGRDAVPGQARRRERRARLPQGRRRPRCSTASRRRPSASPRPAASPTTTRRSRSEHIAGALDDFAAQAKDGSGALFRAYGQSGSAAVDHRRSTTSPRRPPPTSRSSPARCPATPTSRSRPRPSRSASSSPRRRSLCTRCSTADVSQARRRRDVTGRRRRPSTGPGPTDLRPARRRRRQPPRPTIPSTTVAPDSAETPRRSRSPTRRRRTPRRRRAGRPSRTTPPKVKDAHRSRSVGGPPRRRASRHGRRRSRVSLDGRFARALTGRTLLAALARLRRRRCRGRRAGRTASAGWSRAPGR